jgi:hypothetical protein
VTLNAAVTSVAKQTRGIPGRVFVWVFVVALIIIGSLTFAVGRRFQTIMDRLEVVRSLWPNASQELNQRYALAITALEDLKTSASARSEIAQLRTEFELTSQFDRQSVAAAQLEEKLGIAVGNSSWNREDFERPALSKLINADRQRKRVQDGMIGWLTIRGLRLKLPPIFDPLPTGH